MKTIDERVAELREELKNETRDYCRVGIDQEICRVKERGVDWRERLDAEIEERMSSGLSYYESGYFCPPLSDDEHKAIFGLGINESK